MPIATNRRPAVVKGTVSTLLLTFFIFPATGPAQEGFAFHFKSRLGIADGIECRLSLMVDKSPHGHPLAIITPIFYGMPSLPAPSDKPQPSEQASDPRQIGHGNKENAGCSHAAFSPGQTFPMFLITSATLASRVTASARARLIWQ